MCSAQKGCGTRLLTRLMGNTTRIRVILDGCDPQGVGIGQRVSIGIHDDVVVSASLLVYLLPIVGALLGAWAVNADGDLGNALGALCGMIAGSLLVRWHSYLNRNNPRVNPVLIDSSLSAPVSFGQSS